MKKNYEKAEIKVILINEKDVIATSGFRGDEDPVNGDFE